MMVFNTIFPLFALLMMGGLLKRSGLTSEGFLKNSDRLVYYFFFPAMLFWKLGGNGGEAVSPGLFFAGMCGVGSLFVLTLVAIKRFNIPGFQAGSFVQAGFRFNSYIGLAIVMNTLGEAGIRHFGLLIGAMIPMINVLSVSTLIWHSGLELNLKDQLLYFIKALVSNPLIIACGAGFVFSASGFSFPLFIDNTFSLMTGATLPLALVSIGGGLSFAGLAEHYRVSLIAALLKLVVFPLIGFCLLKFFSVTGVPFQAGMLFFAMPTSMSIYVLSSQLNSDTNLASAAIMLSTLLSFVTLPVILFLL